MSISSKILIIVLLLMMSSTMLLCQSADVPQADTNKDEALSTAQSALNWLLDNSFSAADYVDWGELSINNIDYADAYWDAWDWEEEDYFIEDMINVLYNTLHYTGDTDDKYKNWTVSTKDDEAVVKCSNKRKDVELLLKKDSYGYLITKINITDKI